MHIPLFGRIPILTGIGLIVLLAPAVAQKPGSGTSTGVDCSKVTCSPSTVSGLGSIVIANGVTFRVWAPNASDVSVVGTFNNWDPAVHKLCPECSGGTFTGYWSADVSTAKAGDQYEYSITYGTSVLKKRDPRGRVVTHSGTDAGATIVYDPSLFAWETDAPPKPATRDLVIYEMHVGSFYAPGGAPATFYDAINKLDHVVSLGATAVEVLPCAEFPGELSWGYNPADLHSVENIAYGGPDAFKEFVKAAHARKLAVIVDVVHNHYGPNDLDMWKFDGWTSTKDGSGGGIYFYEDSRRSTPWGDTRPNYDSSPVRQFIFDQIRMLVNEYHVDGFRWDATCFIRTISCAGDDIAAGKTLMQEANDMIDSNWPHVFSHAEDLQGWTALTASSSSGGFGFDSQWDPAVHAIRSAATAASDADRNINNIASELKSTSENGNPLAQVWYSESHDEVGCLNSKQRLPSAISSDCTSLAAKKRSIQAATVVMTAPAIPMLFMGQEFLECGCWGDNDPLEWSRTTTYAGILQYYKDIIAARRNLGGFTRGLQGPNINVHHVNDTAKVLAYHRWDLGGENDDVVVVANYSGSTLSNYNIGFPHGGTWRVRVNSDSATYDGSFGNTGGDVVASGGCKDTLPFNGNVNIGPYSVLILSQGTGDLNDTNPGSCSGTGTGYSSVYVPGDNSTVFGAVWDPCNASAKMTKVADFTWRWEKSVTRTVNVQYKFAMDCGWTTNRGLGSSSGTSLPQTNTDLVQDGGNIAASLPKGTCVWEFYEDTNSSKLFLK